MAIYATDFKKRNGFGYWLAEYKRMDEQGLFTPEKLRETYIKILKGTSPLGFIYRQAISYICVRALDALEYANTQNCYDVRLITGEVAINDEDEELVNLSLEEATNICLAMNSEAEELLFKVYNTITKRFIKI